MTLPTYDSAVDEMMELFRAKWEADTPALNSGTALPVEWPGIDYKTPKAPDQSYAKVTLIHRGGRQRSMGPVGARRFSRAGFVLVQTMAPLSAGVGSTFAEKLAIIARDAYEGVGTDSGIWFREVRAVDVGEDRDWYRIDVYADFNYDELK